MQNVSVQREEFQINHYQSEEKINKIVLENNNAKQNATQIYQKNDISGDQQSQQQQQQQSSLLYSSINESSIINSYEESSLLITQQLQDSSPMNIQACNPDFPNISQQTNKNKQANIIKKYSITLKEIYILSFVIFCIQYGYSIENVFISPFFLKLDTPDLLDSLVWLMPSLIDIFIHPYLRILLQKRLWTIYYRKFVLMLFGACSILGLVILAFARFLTLYLLPDYFNKKFSILSIVVIGFILQDVGHDMMELITYTYLKDAVEQKDRKTAQSFILFSNSFGQVSAYFLSSALAFKLDFLEVQNFMQNLTFSYCIGSLLILLALYFIWNNFDKSQIQVSQMDNEVKMQEEQMFILLKNVKLNKESLLPGIEKIKNLPIKMYYLLASHFLTGASLYLVSVYATLWTGISILENSQNAKTRKLRNYLFDQGISWGALTLCLAAFLHFFTSVSLQLVRSIKKLQKIYIGVYFITSISLFTTYFSNSFYSLLISLPLWGVQNSTYNFIPYRICDYLERKYGDQQNIKLQQFLYISWLSCQIFIFLIIPSVFLFFSSIDDVQVSLFMAGFSGLAGSLIGMLV